MGRLKRPSGLAVGQRVQFDGQVRAVLGVTAQAAVLEDAEAPHRVVALIVLFEAADFKVLFQPERMPLPPVGLLETFPPEAVKQLCGGRSTFSRSCTGCRRTPNRARLHGPDTGPGRPRRPGSGSKRRSWCPQATASPRRQSATGAAAVRRRVAATWWGAIWPSVVTLRSGSFVVIDRSRR